MEKYKYIVIPKRNADGSYSHTNVIPDTEVPDGCVARVTGVFARSNTSLGFVWENSDGSDVLAGAIWWGEDATGVDTYRSAGIFNAAEGLGLGVENRTLGDITMSVTYRVVVAS